MIRPTRTTTAVAAAASLGGLGAAAVAAGQPTEPPPEAGADAGTTLATGALSDGVAPSGNSYFHAAGRAVARFRAERRARARARAKRRSGFTIVHLRQSSRVSLRAKPGGRVLRRVSARTEFGSPQTLTVTKRHGRWLGVTSSTLPNGRIGWVNGRSDKLQKRRTRLSVHVDVSRRMLELRDGRHPRRTVRVALGAKVSPTPPGRYAITDKLSGARYGGVYGCCILAMSGRQTNLPPGWTGGSRLAIHGSPGRSGAFAGSSAGCVRADRRTLHVLMRDVPLGTPVFVRP